MTKPLPIPPHVRDTLLAALDIMREECGYSRNLQDTRDWLRELDAAWPTLDDVPDGKDVFEGKYPVSGEGCHQ